MKVQVKVEYTVTISAAEYRLLGLALSGKIRQRNDKIDAMTLNRRLQALRSKNLKLISDQATFVQVQAQPKVEAQHETAKAQEPQESPREDGAERVPVDADGNIAVVVE